MEIRLHGTEIPRFQIALRSASAFNSYDTNCDFMPDYSRVGKERLLTLEGMIVRSTETDAGRTTENCRISESVL